MRELPVSLPYRVHLSMEQDADLVSCRMVTLIVADWLGVVTK